MQEKNKVSVAQYKAWLKRAIDYENKIDEVTLKFNNAKGLLMYRFGQKMLVRLPSNGEYKFKLYPGEGRYLIPIK